MSLPFVKPYVRTNKKDYNDAEAICEALSRRTMRYLVPKKIDRQDLQSLRQVRRRLIQGRTDLVNEIHGLLAEYGFVVPKHIGHLGRRLPIILADSSYELEPLGGKPLATCRESSWSLMDGSGKLKHA